MKKVIDSIEKGYGEDSILFRVGTDGVTKIEESFKPIMYDDGGIARELIVYNVFTGDKLVCEIESNSGLCISF